MRRAVHALVPLLLVLALAGPAGAYEFQCEEHPEMHGTFVSKAVSEGRA